MKKVYRVQAGWNGCVSSIGTEVERIPAGTAIYSMNVKDKGGEYQKFADDYDIHLII